MAEKKVSIIKNYIYNAAFQVLTIVMPLLTAPYVSRVIGVDGIGAYSLTQAWASYFVLFANLGLTMYGQREIAYQHDDIHLRSRTFFEVLIFRAITTLIALIAYFFFIGTVTDALKQQLLLIQIMTILAVVADVSWFFQGMEEFKIIVIRNTIVKLIGTACIFLFVRRGEDLWIYVTISTVTMLLGNLTLWFYLPRFVQKYPFRELRPFRNTKIIIELFIPMIAIQVYNVLDKTMIGYILESDAQNGYYEQTTKIVNMAISVVTALGAVIMPRMAANYSEGKKEEFQNTAYKAFDAVFLVSCPIAFGLIGISQNFAGWFFGEQFLEVGELLQIYALVAMIIPVSNIAANAVLTPTGQQNKGTIAVVIGAIVNFTLNMILIRSLLSEGAAIATVAAEVTVTAVHLFFVRNVLSMTVILKDYAKHTAAAVFMGAVVYLTGSILGTVQPVLITVIQILVGIIVYYLVESKLLHNELVLRIEGAIFNRLSRK